MLEDRSVGTALSPQTPSDRRRQRSRPDLAYADHVRPAAGRDRLPVGVHSRRVGRRFRRQVIREGPVVGEGRRQKHQHDDRCTTTPRAPPCAGLVVQPAHQTRGRGGRTIARALVAAAVLALALDGGTYELTARHSLAVAIWWMLACGIALRLWEIPERRSPQTVAGLAFAGFAALVAASATWAANAEVAFLEFDRVLLYVGVGALAALTGRRVDTWSDGLALGTAAVAAVALASRFFPSLFPTHNLPQFLPGTAERLSYPVDYWNGLAVLLAIGTPLLLRSALAARRGLARALAAAALPGVAVAIYLTASRTGAASVLVAAGLFVVFASDRWAALSTTLLVSVGSAGAIVVLLDRPVLVNGPFDGATAAAQGRVAAVLVLVVCVATGLLNHGLRIGLGHLPRPGRRAGLASAGLALFLALLLIAVSHPRARLVAFTKPPTTAALSRPDFVQMHLLSSEGGGRWQFWGAAVREFESRPLLGQGAGSYESWWAEHGSLPVFVRYAHSLYLEVLGELGLLGLLLLLAALGSALIAGITAITRARGVERTTLGALFAAATAFLIALGVDWMWQLTVVSVVGVACLGLVTGSARRPKREPTRPAHRGVVRGALVVTALLAIACEAMPLLTQIEVQASQAAARRGDIAEARTRALAAAHLEPWASSAYLQLALVDEQRRDLHSARRAIRVALSRDDRDWRLWLVSARIETKLGAIDRAKRSIARAIRLNPRSSIFNRRERDLSAHR